MADTGYGTRDVARIAGVPLRIVRALVHDAVLTPRRGARGAWLFSMQDVVLLRTAAELRGQLSPRRLHRALRKLRAQLPAGRALTSVRITAEGDQVVVRDGRSAWEPATGQGLLALHASEVARELAPLALRQLHEASAGHRSLTAEQWYELGCDLELSSPQQARNAYARALELDAHHADARVNFGRLLHEAGDTRTAATHYRAALTAGGTAASMAIAAFNLGVASEDLGDWTIARNAYETSLRLAPHNADAHFNLACLLERDGNKAGALRHLRECRKLRDGQSGERYES